MDILTCRIILSTGWSEEYVKSRSIDMLGKIMSFEEGVAMIHKVAHGV